jgi:anti-anti-sigma factor
MTPIGTCRVYRPDPTSIGVDERWGGAGVNTSRAGVCLVLRVDGEIDASNSGRLADYVERHAGVGRSLVVDTSAVDFFGVPALASLHRVDRCCQDGGVAWLLVAGPALRRVMRICGTKDLPRARSVELALAQLDLARASVLR